MIQLSQIVIEKDVIMKNVRKNVRFQFLAGAVLSLMIFSGCDLFKSGKNKVLVVNVLNEDLYNDCHIPGSIQVDFDKVADASKRWSKSSKIIMYCANYACSASASAARDLKAQGFDAYEYGAGMAGWLQAGLPVVGAAQSPYLHQSNDKPSESAHDVPEVTTEELQQLLNVKGEQ